MSLSQQKIKYRDKKVMLSILGRPYSYYCKHHVWVFSFSLDTAIEYIEKEINEYIRYSEISGIMQYTLSVEGNTLYVKMTYYCTKVERQSVKKLKFKIFVDTDLELVKNRVQGLLEYAEGKTTVARPHLVTVKKKYFFGMFHTQKYLYGMFYAV